MTTVSYGHSPSGNEFRERVEQLVVRTGARTVYDLGGGANPVLSEEFIATYRLTYVILDASEAELSLSPTGYDKLVVDLETSAPLPAALSCDLAISSYVLEHLSRPERFHENVHAMLRHGGGAAHYFSTLYALPFVMNRLMPRRLAARLAKRAIPERDVQGRQAIFPARYRWCRGPTPRQIRRFERAGFDVDEYHGYFGHSYFRTWSNLQRLEYAAARTLANHPVPALTSFGFVSLRKRF